MSIHPAEATICDKCRMILSVRLIPGIVLDTYNECPEGCDSLVKPLSIALKPCAQGVRKSTPDLEIQKKKVGDGRPNSSDSN